MTAAGRWTGRPHTEALGAVLLTGFLGGATVLHLRVGDPWSTHVLFASYVGALVWAGLLLRRPAYRVLLPFQGPTRPTVEPRKCA